MRALLRSKPVKASVLLSACLVCLASGGTTKRQKKESGAELIAQGEAFQNLTVVTERLESADHPVISPDGRRLVFVSEKDGNLDIFMKPNPTGAAIQKLTTHGAADIHPVFSPDGKRIAFATKRSGNYDIFILSSAGGAAKRQVTDSQENEFYPSWSPDGSTIAYARYSNIDGKFYIWTKDLDTGANTQLGPGTMPRYSPDGKLILFQKVGGVGARWYSLWLMNPDGGNLIQLTPDDEWGAIQPAWSPDGRRIVFVSSKGMGGQMVKVTEKMSLEEHVLKVSGNNLWIITAPDGAGLTQLTAHAADDWGPHWSRTNHIYFASKRDGKPHIWRFTPMLTDGYVPRAPAISKPAAPAPAPPPPAPRAPDNPADAPFLQSD
jgi:TolB protein